jgi:hypothetical protein
MKKFIVCSLWLVCGFTVTSGAQSKVVFDNQSGEQALVKLVGPTQTEVDVPNGAKVGADAAAGRYAIKVRYGTPGNYHYAKGQEFEVKETATTRSETTITLHKVVAGNYETEPISGTEFNAGRPPSTRPKQSQTASPETHQDKGETQPSSVRALLGEYIRHADALKQEGKEQEALCVYKNAFAFDPGDKDLARKIGMIQPRVDYTSPAYQRFFNEVFPKVDFNQDLANWPPVDGKYDAAELKILMERKAVGDGKIAQGQPTGGNQEVPLVFFVEKPEITATDLVKLFGTPQQDGALWQGGLRAITYGRIRFLVDAKGNTLCVFRRMKAKE